MTGWRLAGPDLTRWLEDLLRAGTRVIAPVEEDGRRVFKAVDAAARVCLLPGKTRWSPKEFVFPKTEALFSYVVQAGGVRLHAASVDPTEQVLFGVRPCDAAGLARLDATFLGGETDPLYARRRELTTVVSLVCAEAEPECFCTAVGGSPAGEDGSDLQLLPLDGGWLVRPLTPKGERLAAPLSGWAANASDEEWEQARASVRRVEESIRHSAVAQEWAALLESSFDSPVWEALGRRCLGCSICTYVCPSCSCFDVNDSGTVECGERCRSWDSCTFALFTRQASGHNPRPTQASRYRQRVLHKFAYFPQQHEGRFMCVGCGRCVKMCPVGMDVQEAVRMAVAASRGSGDAER